MKNNSDLIQKSVRLPTYLIEYIEEQDGRDFSKKLLGLLNDVYAGDEKRRRDIADYQRLIAQKQQKLRQLSGQIYDAARILDRLAGVLADAEDMLPP